MKERHCQVSDFNANRHWLLLESVLSSINLFLQCLFVYLHQIQSKSFSQLNFLNSQMIECRSCRKSSAAIVYKFQMRISSKLIANNVTDLIRNNAGLVINKTKVLRVCGFSENKNVCSFINILAAY